MPITKMFANDVKVKLTDRGFIHIWIDGWRLYESSADGFLIWIKPPSREKSIHVDLDVPDLTFDCLVDSYKMEKTWAHVMPGPIKQWCMLLYEIHFIGGSKKKRETFIKSLYIEEWQEVAMTTYKTKLLLIHQELVKMEEWESWEKLLNTPLIGPIDFDIALDQIAKYFKIDSELIFPEGKKEKEFQGDTILVEFENKPGLREILDHIPGQKKILIKPVEKSDLQKIYNLTLQIAQTYEKKCIPCMHSPLFTKDDCKKCVIMKKYTKMQEDKTALEKKVNGET